MAQNIVRVVEEGELEEILNTNNSKIVTIMFSSQNCPPCKTIKPKFVELASIYSDCYFVYIDIDNFEPQNSKYLDMVEGTPKFIFYFNMQDIAFVMGSNYDGLNDTMKTLVSKLEEKKTRTKKTKPIQNKGRGQQDTASTTAMTATASATSDTTLDEKPINQKPKPEAEPEPEPAAEPETKGKKNTVSKEQKLLQLQQLKSIRKNAERQQLMNLHYLQQLQAQKDKEERLAGR